MSRGGHSTCHHRIYSLTCEEFDELLARANGRCEKCGAAETDTPIGHLLIDHDSGLGTGWDHVRGMLCSRCNTAFRYVDNGSREPSLEQKRYLDEAWYWTHHPSPGAARTEPPGRRERCASVPVRVAANLWKSFGRCAGRRQRSTVLVAFIRWYLHEPGAKRPQRPHKEDLPPPPSSSRSTHLTPRQAVTMGRHVNRRTRQGLLTHLAVTARPRVGQQHRGQMRAARGAEAEPVGEVLGAYRLGAGGAEGVAAAGGRVRPHQDHWT